MIARQHPARLVLLGHPVSHSLSPKMHNAALRSVGLTQRYDGIDVELQELGDILQLLSGENGAGNVTVPHKEAVFSLCNSCSPIAKRAGAVNTFWFDDSQLVGHNTDVDGAKLTIEALVPEGLSQKKCAIIGAGGSAAAVLLALDLLQVGEVWIYNRSIGRATQLAERVSVKATECATLQDAISGAALVVNATPVGLWGNELPFDPDLLEPDAALFDLTYRANASVGDHAADTPLILAARERGVSTRNGLGMLVEQGALSFECWFGIAAPRDVMRHAVGLAHPVR